MNLFFFYFSSILTALSIVVGLVDIAVVIAFVSCFIYLKVISGIEAKIENNDHDEIGQIEMGNIGNIESNGTNGTNGAMVGIPIPPGTSLCVKDVTVAMPSPRQCEMLVGDAKKQEERVVSTMMGNGVVIETRMDGTEVVQLSFSAIMYCPKKSII